VTPPKYVAPNFVGNTPANPSKFIQNTPATPPKYIQNTPANPVKYTQNTPATPPKYNANTPVTPPKYVQNTPANPAKYIQNSPATPPNYIQNTPVTPVKYIPNIPVTPPKYSTPNFIPADFSKRFQRRGVKSGKKVKNQELDNGTDILGQRELHVDVASKSAPPIEHLPYRTKGKNQKISAMQKLKLSGASQHEVTSSSVS